MSELNRTPFHSRHVALGAKMVDFGGWEMPVPVSYTHLTLPTKA